jgi:hypothetical protein
MRPPRNPFRLRAAEQIADDWTFLSLYEPGLLAFLPEDGLWDQRVVVRSSPGGGKTTLLRLFTPGPLRLLHAQSRDEALRELNGALVNRGALAPDGPRVAGALLSLAGKYAPLDQLTSIDDGQRLRAFLAMLNARVLLASVRAHLELAALRYPDDLSRLTLGPSSQSAPSGLEFPANGQAVYEWARQLEMNVARALSSLGPADQEQLPGDDELASLEVLGRGAISVDGQPTTARTLVMLDDVHRLSATQRDFLIDTLTARRAPTPVWIAERREALAPDVLLSLGAKEARDQIIVDIERYWREGGRRGAFESHALRVADRRTRLAPAATATSFATMLQRPDDRAYADVLGKVEERLVAATEGRSEFAAWIENRRDHYTNAREQAITLRALEIRIRRELARSQLSFDVFVRDEASLDELDSKREAANVRDAAELFLCREHDLPYYFGPERLAQLGSVNVDQFLDLAGDLFEELSGASVRRQSPSLTPVRQHQLVERAVKTMWNRFGTGVRDGNSVRGLLDGIGAYAADRTYEDTAPYAPGVTGVAIRRSQAEHLQAALTDQPASWEAQLARVLATLISQNLVTVRPSEAKGQRWAVYYLNRALCVRYRLPLGLGGWQPVSPDTLYGWSIGDRVRPSQPRLAA